MQRSILRRSRLPIAFAAAGAVLLAACGSSGSGGGGGSNGTSTTTGAFGTLPAATGTPSGTGTITYPIENGSQPNYIFPITPSANSSVYTASFQYLLWRPLYWTPEGNRPVINYPLSLASKPVYSGGGKTVTINMSHNYKWSNGKPVTANDAIFFIKLLAAAVKEDPSNFGNYAPGNFPDNVVSVTAPSTYQIVMKLKQVYNPNWFDQTQLNLISPLPSTDWNEASANGPHITDWNTNTADAKKIYDFLAGEAKKVSTYASNPLWQTVDGPFKLTAFNTTTDANTMVPNPSYGGPQKAQYSELKAEYFASSDAETNALRAGKLSMGQIHSQAIPQIPTIKRQGYNVYGYPDLGFSYFTFNFKDTTDNWDKLVSQLYFRQTLAHLQDEAAVIHGGFNDAAVPAYGPVPAIPATPYVPADASTNPYPYSIADAKNLLTSHGWHVVPNGSTTCENPGSGANQCGTGIPKGQKIDITIPTTNDPPVSLQETDQLASAAKQVGINITPQAKTFNFIINQYDDPVAPQNNNKWQMENFGGFTENIYPTTDEIFNTTGSFNEGGYADKKADALIKASKFSTDPAAVQKEASYLTQQLPGIFTPNEDRIYAWKGISGPPDSFSNLTQFGFTPEYWYVPKAGS